MTAYCKVAVADPLHQPYHDHEYGFPVADDNSLFERLVLEINQAGISWATILRKRQAFRQAYSGFDVDLVAAYGETERYRLLNDSGVVRNRLKINAAIENARRVAELRAEFGSFAEWLNRHHPQDRDDWVKLFKRTFLFTGGEIVNEFLMSTGYLPGAHHPRCSVYRQIVAAKPPWLVARGEEPKF